MTQELLDSSLNREHIIPVEISAEAPLPEENHAYNPIRNLPETGFTITTRELLHAIGSKTANLPTNKQDDCLRASLLYTYILDLESQHLRFKPGMDSDLQTPRSQEIGIGITCLIANKLYNIPWDQLESLPGPGLRFDYRAKTNNFDGIFESKGTSHKRNQVGQMRHGIQKKEAHHERGEMFNVELIISSFIGRDNDQPRIMIGDPNFDKLAKVYKESNDRFFRLRHYSRVLQFIGLPKSAFLLYRYARSYLKGDRLLDQTILREKEIDGFLTTEHYGNQRFFGRWFNTIIPEKSKRYKKQKVRSRLSQYLEGKNQYRVFQGVREDVYRAGFGGNPFSHELLTKEDIAHSLQEINETASLFPDGTIQLFRVCDNIL